MSDYKPENTVWKTKTNKKNADRSSIKCLQFPSVKVQEVNSCFSLSETNIAGEPTNREGLLTKPITLLFVFSKTCLGTLGASVFLSKGVQMQFTRVPNSIYEVK